MNPVTCEYCLQCRFYEALADYPYQLSSPAKQKCRHLERCQRVAEFVKKTDHGQQLNLFSAANRKNMDNKGSVQPDIQYLIGDATDPRGDGQKIIAHVCNDIGAWGSGFVVALSQRWAAPERSYRGWHDAGDGFHLGGRPVRARKGGFSCRQYGCPARNPHERPSPAPDPLPGAGAMPVVGGPACG